MRDILFRGQAVITDDWVEGAYVRFRDVKGILHDGIMDEYDGEHITSEIYAVYPATIGQYTGLNDANGKRIFEGDILKFGEKRLVVWWNGEAFQWQAKARPEPYLTYDGSRGNMDWDNYDLGWIAAEIPILGRMSTVVIGNAFDNYELLPDAFTRNDHEDLHF